MPPTPDVGPVAPDAGTLEPVAPGVWAWIGTDGTGRPGPNAGVVVEDDEDGAVRVGHQDGRRWLVEVRQDELDPPRPNSCGKEPARPVARTVTGISLLRTDRRENPPQRG